MKDTKQNQYTVLVKRDSIMCNKKTNTHQPLGRVRGQQDPSSSRLLLLLRRQRPLEGALVHGGQGLRAHERGGVEGDVLLLALVQGDLGGAGAAAHLRVGKRRGHTDREVKVGHSPEIFNRVPYRTDLNIQ